MLRLHRYGGPEGRPHPCVPIQGLVRKFGLQVGIPYARLEGLNFCCTILHAPCEGLYLGGRVCTFTTPVAKRHVRVHIFTMPVTMNHARVHMFTTTVTTHHARVCKYITPVGIHHAKVCMFTKSVASCHMKVPTSHTPFTRHHLKVRTFTMHIVI